MSDTLENKWNKIYSKATTPITACPLLQEQSFLLPAGGRALDLACGRGGNALLLAQRGFAVDAWDLSAVGIKQLEEQAAEVSMTDKVMANVRDVIAEPPPENTYDVIVASYFLHRPLSEALEKALKPNGLLFYQTFHENKLSDSGPKSPDYLLQSNELLHLFPTLTTVYYQEFVDEGDVTKGDRNCGCLVAKKLAG